MVIVTLRYLTLWETLFMYLTNNNYKQDYHLHFEVEMLKYTQKSKLVSKTCMHTLTKSLQYAYIIIYKTEEQSYCLEVSRYNANSFKDSYHYSASNTVIRIFKDTYSKTFSFTNETNLIYSKQEMHDRIIGRETRIEIQ